MVKEILTAFVLQIVFTIGIILFFGFLIALCNRRFYSYFGNKSLRVCYITGFIGTPVHELSHALFCLIFGHKITDIKLFQMNSADGTLGYVNHSYNPKNIYQRIGNFFIGIAPIVVISSILYLLAYLLLPDFVSEINSTFRISDSAVHIGDEILKLLGVLRSFFSYLLSWQGWTFLIVGIFLSLHMTLSKEDIKGALSGVLFLLIGVFVTDVILGCINEKWLFAFTQCMLSVGSFLLCILMLAWLISLLAVLIAFICHRKDA